MTTQAHTQAQIDFTDTHTLAATTTWFHGMKDKCLTYLSQILEDMALQSAIMDDYCGEYFIEPIYLNRLEKLNCQMMDSNTKI